MSDTVAALQTALAPKTGMQRIPFPLETYQHPSLPLSAKRLLNLMAENQPPDARTQGALLSTPGLLPSLTVGTGPIRAMNDDMPGVLYIVSGTQLWRISLPSGPELLGDIGTAVSDIDPDVMVTIAVGPTGMIVCVPPNAFTCDHGTADLNQLGGTFPGGTSVAYLKGYFAFTASGEPSSRFFVCGLLDPSNYDALDFAYADQMPNLLRRVVAHRGELWLIGLAGIEVWYLSGNADFPFRPRPGAVITTRVATARSVTVGDGSVWWVQNDDVVCRSNGYNAQRVSTFAIEEIFRAVGHNPADQSSTTGYAFIYSQGGHLFYCVTTGGTRSVVYDCSTKLWHERSSSADGTGRWLPMSSAMSGDIPILGDSASGALFNPIPGQNTDNGVTLLRQFITPPLWATTRRAFMSRLEIEMGVGDGPLAQGVIELEWSDDGGKTWTGGPRYMNAGTFIGYRGRVFTTRLGSFRQRVFRVTSRVAPTYYAIDADIVAGST